jgi:uncharacterized protein
MQTCFETLTPLARAAVPDHATAFDPSLVLWTETLPGGTAWSGVLRRGNTLRLTDTHGRANVAALFYNAEEKAERYNMPDTLKAQHTAFLSAGHVCYSDMGRVLCSIAADTCGWHDTVCGTTHPASTRSRYGEARYQTHRNAMFRNGHDNFLVELEKWGLDKRDVVANLNLFSKVQADDAGRLQFATAHRAPGQHVDLRFEMNTLVVLSATPHPMDPNPKYDPKDVELTVWRSGTAGADDACRLHCPENGRGLINTERYYL